MSQPCRQRQRARRPVPAAPDGDDRGSLTLMLAVLFVAIVALAGLVIDGGAKLTTAENATSMAQEAARAGAGMVSRATAYEDGRFVIDTSQARAAAEEYLAQSAVSGESYSVVTRARTIQVTVKITQPTRVLSIIDIDDYTVQGTATARLAAGVTGPGQ